MRLISDYRKAVDTAIKLAGNAEGWNERFLLALDVVGLKLENGPAKESKLYPSGTAFTAPHPYKDMDWSPDSIIVWQEEAIMIANSDLSQLEDTFNEMGLEYVVDNTMEAIDVLRIVQGFDKVEGLYDSQCAFIFDKTGCFIKSVIKVGKDTDPMEG